MSKYILNQDYKPAKVVEGMYRWYIEFEYHDGTGFVKVRKTYDLNRIKDLEERKLAAERIKNDLNRYKLPSGYPKVDVPDLNHMILQEAVEKGFAIKCRNSRDKTKTSYEGVIKHFINYIQKKDLDKKPVTTFSTIDAVTYLDETQIEKNLAPRTYNSYRTRLQAIWTLLIKKEVLVLNPWQKTEKMKPQDADRRRFSSSESKAIFNYVWENDKMLALSIILLYYCFIRPGEQRDLKVKNIDLKRGIITIPGDISKNRETEHVTIPKNITPLLLAIGIQEWNYNDYIFGKGIKPHPTIRCGSNSLRERHKSVIRKMKKKGVINDTKGLHLYSWKDSGAMFMVESDINIYDVMRQLRHKELTTTQIYLKHLGEVSEKIRELDFNLLS